MDILIKRQTAKLIVSLIFCIQISCSFAQEVKITDNKQYEQVFNPRFAGNLVTWEHYISGEPLNLYLYNGVDARSIYSYYDYDRLQYMLCEKFLLYIDPIDNSIYIADSLSTYNLTEDLKLSTISPLVYKNKAIFVTIDSVYENNQYNYNNTLFLYNDSDLDTVFSTGYNYESPEIIKLISILENKIAWTVDSLETLERKVYLLEEDSVSFIYSGDIERISKIQILGEKIYLGSNLYYYDKQVIKPAVNAYDWRPYYLSDNYWIIVGHRVEFEPEYQFFYYDFKTTNYLMWASPNPGPWMEIVASSDKGFIVTEERSPANATHPVKYSAVFYDIMRNKEKTLYSSVDTGPGGFYIDNDNMYFVINSELSVYNIEDDKTTILIKNFKWKQLKYVYNNNLYFLFASDIYKMNLAEVFIPTLVELEDENKNLLLKSISKNEICFTVTNFENDGTIYLYDLQGKLVLMDEIQYLNPNSIYQTKCVNIKPLRAGLYFLKVIWENKTSFVKFVVP